MKIIFSNSILSIIFKIIFFVPLLLIIEIIRYPDNYIMCIFFILFFQSGILFLFNSVYGFVFFNDGKLYVSNDFIIFKSARIQNKFTIQIKDIVAIEFAEEFCDSDGIPMAEGNRSYTGIPPYLKLYMEDGSIKRIHLIKFSFKTWKKFEKYLVDINKDILVMNDATSFKKFLKTGID